MGVGLSQSRWLSGAAGGNDAEIFVQMVGNVARLVPVFGNLSICRDPDDDIVLETALGGHATHVVSRDEDVTRDLDLVQRLQDRSVQLLTVSRFLALLKRG